MLRSLGPSPFFSGPLPQETNWFCCMSHESALLFFFGMSGILAGTNALASMRIVFPFLNQIFFAFYLEESIPATPTRPREQTTCAALAPVFFFKPCWS